jgi:hypothetical protein
MREVDTTKLTREDYEHLLQANFLALNKEIVRDNMLFIKEVQLQERLQRDKRQMQLQIQQQLFDPQYSANEAYYNHVPYTPTMDALSNGHHSRHGSSGGNASSSRNSLEAASSSSVALHHSHVYYSPYPPPTLEEFQDGSHAQGGGRSASWSSPMREPPVTDASQTRPRGTSHADYTPYYPTGMVMHQQYHGNVDMSSASPSIPHSSGHDHSPPRSSGDSPREDSPVTAER